MSYDNMKDMRLTPQEVEDRNSPVAQASEENVYPYNLSLTLEDEQLQKLGLDHNDEDCQVGNFLHLHALAEVMGIHRRDTGDGQKCCINLQIKYLSCESEDEENQESDSEMSTGRSAYGG